MVKNLPASTGDTRGAGLIPGLGRSPGVGNGNPLQCSCLETYMNRGAWQATIHGVAKSVTQLSTHAHTHTHSKQIANLQIHRRILEKPIRNDTDTKN